MKLLAILIITANILFACDENCTSKIKTEENDKWVNNFLLNGYYEHYESTYEDLGTSIDTQKVFKLDWMSHIKLSDNLHLGYTLRAISWNADSNYQDVAYDHHVANGGDPYINKDTQLPSYFKNADRTKVQQYTDVHFNSLYMSYILPEINDYKHMIAVGTMPFQGGSFEYYKHNGPKEGTGMSLLINMPMDAIVYVGDLSKISNLDSFQVRIGYGEYLKFADYYKHNEMIGTKTKGTTSKFVNFDIQEGPHNFKLEAYQSDWKYNDIFVGKLTNVGIGYAYDKLDTDGYVVYGTAAISNIKGSYNDMIKAELASKRDDIIAYMMYVTMQQTGLPYNVLYPIVSAQVDAELANPSNETVATVFGVPENETGYIENVNENGWAFQIGAKKEWWVESLDVDWFVGAEYFQSSQHWATQTLRGLPRHGIDPLTKGRAYELYTGFRNNDRFVMTFSYLKEMREWGPMYANDVIGIAVSDSERYLLKNREMFKIDLKWMFLGL